jgi:uncharacterized protein YggE
MKLTKLRTVLTAVTVAAVAGVVALAIPANGAGTADNRFITVTGVGTISVVPDAVRFNASKAGSIIEAVVTAGGDTVQLGGVIPTTLNPSAATEDARAAAVANAKSKASSYAKLLGTSIGKVLSLEEQSSPVYSSPFPTAKAGAADAAGIEIDLGEQDVTVTITVRWALN